MVDLGSAIGNVMPSWGSLGGIGSTMFKAMTIFFLALIVITIVGITLYVVLTGRKFNKQIIIWEKINGKWEITGRDKGMETKFGSVGDGVLYLKKRKKYLALPTIQTGRRVYWYAIREDGEWINIGLEDIDTAMKQAKAKFLHTEMRAWRTSFQSNLKAKLDKPSIMERYGTIIISVVVFAILGLILWFVADRIVSMIDRLGEVTNTLNELMQTNQKVLTSLDRICSTSGMTPLPGV